MTQARIRRWTGRGRFCGTARGLVVLVAGLVTVSAPGHAQQPVLVDDPALKEEHDRTFADVLARPSATVLNLRYADLAMRLGDDEAAIGALERVLYTEPDRGELRYRLGTLYFRLAADQMARSYFASAEGEGVPGARMAAYLAEIDRRLQTSSVSFSAQFGFRHQSNANAGPSAAAIRALGYDTTVPVESARRADGNAFALASLRIVQELGTDRGDLIEAQVTGYYGRQFALEHLNTGLAEVNLGPRLALSPEVLHGWSIKPYVLAGGISLADRPYMLTTGGGVTAAIPVAGVLVEPAMEWRRRRFLNSGDYPSAREQDGRLAIAALAASGYLTTSAKWSARLFSSRNSTAIAHNSYHARGADVGVLVRFSPPFIPNSAEWSLFPFGGWTRTVYDSPDAAVDPAVRRKDREWRVGANLTVPLRTNIGLGLLVQYSKVGSNIPNFRLRNLSVSVGPTLQF